MAAAQPTVFTVDGSGAGEGRIFLIKDGLKTPVDASNPAVAGDEVLIECSGLGAIDGPYEAGGAPAEPLPQTHNPVTVMIGGLPAEVRFAGLSPASPGVYHVRAVIPDGITSNTAVPLVVRVSGQSSPEVTIAVRPVH